MAESKIEWTDYTFNPWRLDFVLATPSQVCWHGDRLQVKALVTILAISNAVVHVVAQFGMIGERLDMVSLEIASSRVATLLAGIFVSRKNSIAPVLVFNRPAGALIALVLAVTVSVVLLPARRPFAGDDSHLCSRFWRMLLTQPITRTPLGRLAHFAPRFLAHLLALHGRDGDVLSRCPSCLDSLASCHGIRVIPTTIATSAFCGDSVMPRPVDVEVGDRLPLLAFSASFETSGAALLIFSQTQAGTCGCYPLGSFACLRHCDSLLMCDEAIQL